MKQSVGIKAAHRFIEDSRKLGYDISGSIFKIDYNGKIWTVGIWIRGAGYEGDTHSFKLAPRLGRAKDKDFDSAVLLAIAGAMGK